MSMLFAAYAVLVSQAAFPPQPLSAEMARGAEVYRKGKGVERTLYEDRQVIGLWFDGKIKRDVEEVIWLSPGMVSRWLGYLNARERWPEAKLEKRWNELRTQLDGSLVFVVRLSALPTQDIFDEENYERIDPTPIRDVRMFISYEIDTPEKLGIQALAINLMDWPEAGTFQLPPTSWLLTEKQDRDWHEVLAVKWYPYLPFGANFANDFENLRDQYSWPIGNCYSAWYLVSAPVPEDFEYASRLNVVVLSENKERRATFTLPVKEQFNQRY